VKFGTQAPISHSAAEGGEEGSLRDIKIGIFWKKSNFYIL
jgi:hypothetical protein